MYYAMPVLAVFDFCSTRFFVIRFFLRHLFLKFVRRCFGRLDGSIRALRKVRFRNEIDNFIESMSQMVPRWSPQVPDGPQRSPKSFLLPIVTRKTLSGKSDTLLFCPGGSAFFTLKGYVSHCSAPELIS